MEDIFQHLYLLSYLMDLWISSLRELSFQLGGRETGVVPKRHLTFRHERYTLQ